MDVPMTPLEEAAAAAAAAALGADPWLFDVCSERADPEKFVLRDQSNLAWSARPSSAKEPPAADERDENSENHASRSGEMRYERLPVSRSVEVYVESRRGDQAVTSPADLVLHVSDSADQLHQLTERMQHHYRSSEPVAFYPHPNEVVAVRWRPLGGWVRAVVCQSIKQRQEYRCRLLDFGCEVRVPQWEVRPIDRKLLDVAAQAIACSLANVAPLDDGAGWSDEARDALRKLLTAPTVAAVYARLDADYASVSRVHLSIMEYQKDGEVACFDCGERLVGLGLCRRAGESAAPADARKHACGFCTQKFFRVEHLVKHERTHTGERPFVCQEAGCHQRFARADTLKQHVRTHTGEKPYECDVCGARLPYRASLSRHMRRVHTSNL